MYIHESGPSEGPPVIFLHSHFSNGTMWNTHMAALINQHCVAPDFPGFGRSNHQEWTSIEDIAEGLVELIRGYAQESKVHLVGVSLGGVIAIKLLGMIPGLFESVVIDGAGVLPRPGLSLVKLGFRLLQPFLHREFIMEEIAHTLLRIPEENFAEFRSGMLSATPRAITRSTIQALDARQPHGLQHVPCRVLFVAGENEMAATLRSNQELSEVVPKAQNRVIREIGNSWIIANPELHLRMVEAWIGDLPLPPELETAEFLVG